MVVHRKYRFFFANFICGLTMDFPVVYSTSKSDMVPFKRHRIYLDPMHRYENKNCLAAMWPYDNPLSCSIERLAFYTNNLGNLELYFAVWRW